MFQSSAIWGDVRYAVRIMCRTPLFTATVVLTVAIAIAANATIFTVVNAVMIRSLPFARPNGIMQVAEKNDQLNLSRTLCRKRRQGVARKCSVEGAGDLSFGEYSAAPENALARIEDPFGIQHVVTDRAPSAAPMRNEVA